MKQTSKKLTRKQYSRLYAQYNKQYKAAAKLAKKHGYTIEEKFKFKQFKGAYQEVIETYNRSVERNKKGMTARTPKPIKSRISKMVQDQSYAMSREQAIRYRKELERRRAEAERTGDLATVRQIDNTYKAQDGKGHSKMSIEYIMRNGISEFQTSYNPDTNELKEIYYGA